MSKYIGDVSAYAYAVSKGYTGTEEEFAELMADYAEVGQRAEDAAESASASATASAQSASQALASEQGCERAVLDATSAAAIARARADEASGYAQTASTKASEAVGCVETATQKATESAQSASQALGYKNDAESAKTASQTAQGLAESARDSAISAKNDAESARDEAQNIVDGISAKAEQIDTNTADIAELESTKADLSELYKAFPTDTASGAIASFSDGADGIPLKSLVVDINPIQDLHGQDSPYPAGGGKNLVDWTGPQTITSQTTLTTYDTSDAVTYTVSTTIVNNASINGSLKMLLYNNNTFVAEKSIVIPANAASARYSVTMDTTGYTFTQIRIVVAGSSAEYSLTVSNVQLEKGSTATAFAPYENICPISGWTSVDVEQSGVNVWDEEWEVGAYNTTNGAKAVSSGQIRSKNHIPISAQTTYHVNTSSNTSAYFKPLFYDENKNYIGTVNSFRDGSFTSPSNAHYMTFHMNANYGTTYNNDISINYPSTDHDYHPYTGRSITINLGQTVYGGKLDVLSGVLVIDRAMQIVSECSSVGTASTGTLCASIATSINAKAEAISNNNISSAYKFRTNAPTDGGWFRVTTTTIFIFDNRFTDKATANAILATEQPMFAYKLATPITVQLTPQQVNSLFGVNNLWADSGDTEVKYRADTKLYIERLTAPDSADMIADANITSGQYFMVGNSLYKATANIANGGQIIVGTNATRVSLAQALNEINA